MRSLLAVALLGMGTVLFSVNAPANAMPTGSNVAKSAATGAESSVQEVGRRHWHGHRHYRGYRSLGGHGRYWRHRHYGHRHYRPYYYGGYSPYYYPYRRRGFGLYFGY